MENLKYKAPKKYQPYIYEIVYFDGVYTCNLNECCCVDAAYHMFSADTLKELIHDMQDIDVIESEEEYISIFGDSLIEDYRKDYIELQSELADTKNKTR